MPTFKIYKPFKPFVITQHWGNANPKYAAHFNDPSFKLHNGVDANTGYQNWDGTVKTEYPVYMVAPGFRVSSIDYYPNGGGNQLELISKEKIKIFDQECYVLLIFCHAKKILVKEGDEPELGELLMIADNTGFSTGLHTHLGMYRLNDSHRKIDTNEAKGSFSPELFIGEEFAVDAATTATLVRSGLRYWKYKAGL